MNHREPRVATVVLALSLATSAAAAEPERCPSSPLRTTGVVHYVCDCQEGAAPGCIPGDDGNAGRSPAAPWRSFAKARAAFLRAGAGDTVALCRGGRWNGVSGPGRWENTRCRAAAPCELRDYDPRPAWGTGNEGPPVIVMAGTAEGMDLFAFGGGRGAPTAGLRFLNIEARGGHFGAVSWGNVADVDFCGMTFDGFGIAAYVAKSSTTTRFLLRHSRIVNSRAQGFLGACDGCRLESSYWDHNGGPTNREHTIYVGANPEPGGPIGGYFRTTGMRIAGNEIRRSAQSGASCVGAPIVVHEPHDGLSIENNLVVESAGTSAGGCWGISVGNGWDAPGDFRNVRILRNRVFNAGNVAISVENCEDCTIEGNLVVLDQTGDGVVAPAHPRSAGVGPNLTNTRTTVRNNTVWFAPSARGGRGIAVGTEGTGHVVANNAVEFAGDRAPDGFACLDLSLPPSSYALVDGNACFHPDVRGEWVRGRGSLGSWRSGTGWDAHSLEAGPLFASPSNDPATADFTPGDRSPLRRAGVPSGPPGTASASARWSPSDPGRSRDTPPDMGAFQR